MKWCSWCFFVIFMSQMIQICLPFRSCTNLEGKILIHHRNCDIFLANGDKRLGCDISSRDWSRFLFPSGCLWKCRSLNLQKHFAIQNGDKNIFVTTSYWLRLNTDTAERLLMLLQSAWGDEAFRKPNAI